MAKPPGYPGDAPQVKTTSAGLLSVLQLLGEPYHLAAAGTHVVLHVARVTQTKYSVLRARQDGWWQILAQKQLPEALHVVWRVALQEQDP